MVQIASWEQETLFGSPARGMHFWSAKLLILIVVAHMLRVFLTAVY